MGRSRWLLFVALLLHVLCRQHALSQADNHQPGGTEGQTGERLAEEIAHENFEWEFKFRGREWHPESFGYTTCSKPKPKIDLNGNIFGCRILHNVCVDQGVIIYQDYRWHPWTSPHRLPIFNITDILWNTPSVLGIGDKWVAGKNRYQVPHLRAWHHMEEADDIRRPVFSNCTTPVVFWHHFPFNVAEVFRFAVNNIYFLQQRLKFFDDHITLVPGNPGRVPSFTQFWLQPFSRYAITSLSSLSQRWPPGTPSNATGEGVAVRCFSQFVMCKLTLRKPTGAFYAAGQFVADYYMKKAAPLEAKYKARLATTIPPDDIRDDAVLKVVFAVRSKSHKDIGRRLLNEDELIDRCNRQEANLPNDPGVSIFRRVRCFRHIFGVDNLYDMWLVRQSDVLVGVHGSALTNAMFMRRGSSLIELRPHGFSGRESWPNIYMKSQTRGMEVFWYGIDVMNTSLSTPGDFEADMQPIYTRALGCLSRDRNLIVPWEAFKEQLLNVAVVSRSVWRYKVLRYSHAYYLTHDLQALELPGKDRRLPQELQSWFRSLEEERAKAAAIALTPEGEEAARAAEEQLMRKLHDKWEQEAAAKEEAAKAHAAGDVGGRGDSATGGDAAGGATAGGGNAEGQQEQPVEGHEQGSADGAAAVQAQGEAVEPQDERAAGGAEGRGHGRGWRRGLPRGGAAGVGDEAAMGRMRERIRRANHGKRQRLVARRGEGTADESLGVEAGLMETARG